MKTWWQWQISVVILDHFPFPNQRNLLTQNYVKKNQFSILFSYSALDKLMFKKIYP